MCVCVCVCVCIHICIYIIFIYMYIYIYVLEVVHNISYTQGYGTIHASACASGCTENDVEQCDDSEHTLRMCCSRRGTHTLRIRHASAMHTLRIRYASATHTLRIPLPASAAAPKTTPRSATLSTQPKCHTSQYSYFCTSKQVLM